MRLFCVQIKNQSRPVDLKGVHVLLAEDNDLNAEIATVQLESLGIDVVRAMNGKNALQIFETRPKAALTLS